MEKYPAPMAMASAMPITATEDNHGYLVSIRIPSFTSSHDIFMEVLRSPVPFWGETSFIRSGTQEVRKR